MSVRTHSGWMNPHFLLIFPFFLYACIHQTKGKRLSSFPIDFFFLLCIQQWTYIGITHTRQYMERAGRRSNIRSSPSKPHSFTSTIYTITYTDAYTVWNAQWKLDRIQQGMELCVYKLCKTTQVFCTPSIKEIVSQTRGCMRKWIKIYY